MAESSSRTRMTVRVRSRLAENTKRILLELADGRPHLYKQVIREVARTVDPAVALRAGEHRRLLASSGDAPQQRVRPAQDSVLVRQGQEYIVKRAANSIEGVYRETDDDGVEWIWDARHKWPVVDEVGHHLSAWCAFSDPEHPQCAWRFCQCDCHPELTQPLDQVGQGVWELGPPATERCPNDKTPLADAAQPLFIGFGDGKYLWVCSIPCGVAELRVELAAIREAEAAPPEPPTGATSTSGRDVE